MHDEHLGVYIGECGSSYKTTIVLFYVCVMWLIMFIIFAYDYRERLVVLNDKTSWGITCYMHYLSSRLEKDTSDITPFP